jgi:hypothetical protein
MQTVGRYLLALLLTVALEGGVAWLFGFRTGKSQLIVAMVNCITNPILNLLLLALAWQGVPVSLLLVTLLEVLVVLVEWRLLEYNLGGSKGRLLLLSFAANTTSFLAGVVLFWRVTG